jgi:hypothetical protein
VESIVLPLWGLCREHRENKKLCQQAKERMIVDFNRICLRNIAANVNFKERGERRLWGCSVYVMFLNVKMKGLAHC